MVTKLPEFKGYTVDKRLKQFRKVDREKPSIDFVDNDSKEGKKLLDEIKDQEEKKQNVFNFFFFYICHAHVVA